MNAVRTWWQESGLHAYHPRANQGHLRTLTLREGVRTGEKMAILTVSEEKIDPHLLDLFTQALPDLHSVILRRQIIQRKTSTRFEEITLRGANSIHEILYDTSRKPYRFRIKAPSFFQPNTYQAEKIYQTAMEMASIQEGEAVLDLYCGGGALGIFAARAARSVLGIELVPEAVEDGVFNCALNGITNMEIISGNVAESLHSLPFMPHTVIVDPPRAGLGKECIAHLLTLKPEKILYVSCNPATQAADCAPLCQQGYHIVALQPIDQFPHTSHLENIALLQLAN